jgi:hypothetical protein
MFSRTQFSRWAAGLVAIILIPVLTLAAAGARASSAPFQTTDLSAPDVPAPLVLNYQGRLADPLTGAAKPDGTYQMVFALYDVESGGSSLWTETRDVSVRGGLFSIRLGEITPIPAPAIFDGRAIWLAITVGADPQTSPRLPVSFVAYALYANRAATAGAATTAELAANSDRLGGQPPASYAPASHAHDADAITSGTLSTDRFAAYADLVADARIGEAAGQVAAGNHAHTGATIVDSSITTADLADESVTSAKIADGNVVNADLAANSVDGSKIADLSIGTADLAAGAVTLAKISTTGAAANEVIQYDGARVIWDYAPGSEIRYTVLNVTCVSVATFTTAYAKIADIGTVNKVDATSRLEITFNGRIHADSVTSTGALFELRVDDVATTNGRARASLKAPETGGNGVPVSIMGVFTGYGAGARTVSMWVRASYGSGTGGSLDPGCWSSDHIVIREIK